MVSSTKQTLHLLHLLLSSLYVIGAVVALSSPYWVSSTFMLAPLAAFAATPLGMSVLAFVAVALVSLAIYSISKNNEISELKASRIVVVNNGKQVVLLVTKEVYEEMKKNNQNKDKDGKVVEGEYRINFSLAGKDYYVTAKIESVLCGIVLLEINSLAKKNEQGDYVPISDDEKKLEELGLNKEENEGVNTYLGSLIVKQVASEEKAKS